ncbi:MAG: carboxypeptidase-like regulatory domain-containing protein, partial [Planctomycetota bacterium]|nr:carboxypeptidase-like regulatory domain-containing protein [Planctomycetota bacterium]
MLTLIDRHWYAPRPVELADVSAGAVELEVRRGACLLIRPTVSQGDLVGTLTVSGFDMRGGRGSGRLDFDLVAGEEILVRGLDPAQAWTVAPEAEAHHCAMKSGVEIAAGDERVLDLAFVPGATIAGRVVDESGNGVEGVDIGTASRMPWMGSAGARRTKTAGDGSFLLKGVAPGEVQLEAKLEGWRDAEIESMDVADLERIDGMRVEMTRGASITGIVRWGDGTPAAGARVRATRVSRAQWGGWGGGRVQTAASAEADADGTFALGGLDDGQYTVRASHWPADVAAAESSPRWRADLPARTGESIELTLIGPATITGLVVDDRGEPVPEFEVVAQPAESGVRSERASFASDDGRFSFARIGTGEWTLEARAEHMVPAGGVDVALPGEAGVLTLRLDRAATVTGRVTDPAGAPVADADVRVEESSSGRGGWGGDRARFRARSGEDGGFLLEDLPPPTTTLVV